MIFRNFSVAPRISGPTVSLNPVMKAKLHRTPPHRLIRHIRTGLYLSTNGKWVRDEHEAFDFPDLRTALATCEQMQGRGVEMIVVFEGSNPSRSTRLDA